MVARHVVGVGAMFDVHRRRVVVVGVPFLRADVTTYERARSRVPRSPRVSAPLPFTPSQPTREWPVVDAPGLQRTCRLPPYALLAEGPESTCIASTAAPEYCGSCNALGTSLVSQSCLPPISRRPRPTVVTVRLLLKLLLRPSFHSSVALIARSNRVPSTPRSSLARYPYPPGRISPTTPHL
jgi:hypothetical protein